jgi:hypothetical protein
MNQDLIKYAKAVGNKMSAEYISKGDYYPEEAWGCEGQIYPSLMGIALLELFKVENDSIYLDAVKSIIETNIKKQMPSGGWALSLGAIANGIRFEVTEEIKQITANIEDLPPTATALRLIADYYLHTGDNQYNEPLIKGYAHLKKFWNKDAGLFNEMLVGEALKLRANPKNYQMYAYQCVCSISKIIPDAEVYISPLYNSIKQIFEEMDADTYPLLYAMYAALIIQTEGNSDYVKNVVNDRIVNDITFGSRFKIENVPGAMGHRDGLRGICTDEGHLRNSIGAALILKFHDKYIGTNNYTETEFYKQLEHWIQSMYNDGRYYEFVDINTGKKQGLGTPGQYLSIWWILGII